jgi:hypothetical protein
LSGHLLPIISQNHITGHCSGKRTQHKKILIFREEKKRKKRKETFETAKKEKEKLQLKNPEKIFQRAVQVFFCM